MPRVRLRDVYDEHSDPREAILLRIDDRIAQTEVFHNYVLVAIYIRPEKTKGGVYVPDRSLEEDRFQGKVGCVVGLGPCAFKDDNVAKFGGVTIKQGDWVIFRPGDGFELWSVDKEDRGTSCRLFEDTRILGRVADPSFIW